MLNKEICKTCHNEFAKFFDEELELTEVDKNKESYKSLYWNADNEYNYDCRKK